MRGRWIVMWPVLVVCLVLVAVLAILLTGPGERPPLRTVSIRPVPVPTPDLPSTPWREALVEVHVPTPEPPPASQSPVPGSGAASETTSMLTPPVRHDDEKLLLQRLLGMTYLSYRALGETRRGVIEDTLRGVQHQVYEGYELVEDAIVEALSDKAAVVRLAAATYTLPKIERPAFLDDPDLGKRMPTEEEQQLAKKYYIDRFGDLLAKQAEDYKPLPGTRMPKKLTPEENAAALEEYQREHGDRFRKEQENAQPFYSQRNPALEIEARRKYWEQYHPDKPLPPGYSEAETP